MSKKIGYDMSLTAKSNAKINLFLHITGKRDDGFHNIYSLFVPINLHDTITITPNVSTMLLCNKSYIPTNQKNIILKVDKILREEYGLERCFRIDLVKRIPVGAGLGGGSSNGVAYLNLALQASGIELSMEEKEKIMARVGSDTVFFLHNKPAIVTGRGENLHFLDFLPNFYILIIYPNIFLSTKDVYSSSHLSFTDENNLPKINNNLTFNDIISFMKNDMEVSAFNMYPNIKEIVDNVNLKGNGKALMSGSGSTVFAIYESKDKRDIDFENFVREYPDYFIKKAELIKS